MNTQINSQIRSFNFSEYNQFITELVNNGSCSGEISEEHIQATKLNAHRIKRIYNQIEIDPKLEKEIRSLENDWEWIVLIESWCGDGSQNLPIIAKIASLSAKIKLTILLRDENPAIMQAQLTNGARAIPKLICFDSANKKEIGIWGPRPASIQEKVRKIKSEYPLLSHDEFGKNLHSWYALDKGSSIQTEFIDLINEWKNKSSND
jgi:hypothetical protein